MEYEVLNEILTGTVSRLFTATMDSHAKMYSSGVAGNEPGSAQKSEIPMSRGTPGRSSTPKVRPRSNSNHGEASGPVTQKNNFVEPHVKEPEGSNAPGVHSQGDWVNREGRKFLDESLKRLKIEPKSYVVIGRGPITDISIDDLNSVKRKVKVELKRYDQTFTMLFLRQPCKDDKEPLRPLYMFYKKLKQVITKK